jgi:hypothetical protein
MAALARRLGLGAAATAMSGLLLVSAPVVLAMVTTAMPDIAAMALSIVALERLVAWRDTHRWPAAVAAAAAFSAAILARSHAVLLLPLTALLLCREPWRAREWRPTVNWLPLLVVPLLVGAARQRQSTGPTASATTTARYRSAGADA